MKKILILFAFLALTITVSAQSFEAFWRPVDKGLFKPAPGALKATVNPSVWVFRPTVEITAVALTWDKTTKQFDSAPLSSIGPGISYSHYIALPDGSPYNNFSINALLLLGADIEHINPATISLAGTVSVLQFVNVGAGYNFGDKQFFILTGVTLKF